MHLKPSTRRIVAIASMLLLSTMFFTATQILKAEDSARIYVDPTENYAASGYTFSVNIILEEITDLYGWELKLYWNNSLLECITDIVYTPLGCNWEEPNNLLLGPGIEQEYNRTHGRYFRGLAAIPLQEPHPTPFSGTTLLLTLTFTVKTQGSCTLALKDIKLADPDPRPIPCTAEDGYFESGPPETKIYVDPPISYAASGYTFSVNIMLGSVADLCGWEFKVFWDNSKLECIAEDMHYPPGCHWEDPNNIKTGSGITDDYNATHGRYDRSLSRQSATEPYPTPYNGTLYLATLTFNATYVGECILSLYETELEDSKANPIQHSTANGYVKIIPSTPPKASFTYSPKTPFVNQTVTFNASDSTSRVGEIVKYAWNFGDGITVAETDHTTTHVYTLEGTFNVTLNVTDTTGMSGTLSKSVEILGPCGPKAKFVYSPKAPLVNGTVTFDASVSEPGWNGTGYAPIISYEWNFGDGTTILVESGPVVTHVFEEGGSYNVTLKVTDIGRVIGLWNSTSCLVYIFRSIPSSSTRAVLVEPPCYFGEVTGETFTIEVIALNVQDVVGFEFKLDYDNTILDAKDIALGPFLKEPIYVPKKEIDNEMGRIWLAATMLPPLAPAHGNIILAAINFEVTGLGLCIFDLYDLKISTPWASHYESQLITPTIHNVAVVSIATSATEFYAGETVNITVVAENSGNAVESFNVTLFYNTSVIATKTVTNLEPGTEITLEFNWDTTDVTPDVNYLIMAKATALLEEMRTADNLYNYGAVNIRAGDVKGNGGKGVDYAVKVGLALIIGVSTICIGWILVKHTKPKEKQPIST